MPSRGFLSYYLIKDVIEHVALSWIPFRRNETMEILEDNFETIWKT